MAIGLNLLAFASFVLLSLAPATAQVIEFESGGLHYQTLTKSGVTVMFAEIPTHIRGYALVQAAVSNGSPVSWTVRPDDFAFRRQDGTELKPLPARDVVGSFVEKASRGDVIKLVSTYENALYGMEKFRSTNGYEVRRQNALAEVSSARIKAAAAASAIAFVLIKIAPGESTDGALFYPTGGKALGAGKMLVKTAGEVFEFESYSHVPGSQ